MPDTLPWYELPTGTPWCQVLADGRVIRITPGEITFKDCLMEHYIPDEDLDALIVSIVEYRRTQQKPEFKFAEREPQEDCPDAD